MPQTTVSIRMDEKLKKELEWLCSELGMNITTAMTIFAKTATRERRIPFSISLAPAVSQKAIEDMTKYEFDTKIQTGVDAVAEGCTRPASEAYRDMQRKYSV